MNFFHEEINMELGNGNGKLDNLSKSIIAAEKVLMHVLNKKGVQYKEHDIVIIAFYRKNIEHADGFFILMDHQSNSISISAIRSFFESYVGLSYILEDEDKVVSRALAYQYNYIREQINWTQKAIKNQVLKERYSDEELLNIKRKLEQKIQKGSLSETKKEWDSTRKKIKYPKWYSLNNGPKSFTDLAQKINAKNYKQLYAGYSLDAHGYKALSDIKYNSENEKYEFKPIRGMDNRQFETSCALSTSMLSFLTGRIINRYCPELLEDFRNFFKLLDRD